MAIVCPNSKSYASRDSKKSPHGVSLLTLYPLSTYSKYTILLEAETYTLRNKHGVIFL